MATEPGADERRIAYLLRQEIDGPTADQTEEQRQLIPPPPAYAPDVPGDDAADWVDEILAQTRTPAKKAPLAEQDESGDQGGDPAEGEDPNTAAPSGWMRVQHGYYPTVPTVLPIPQQPAAALSPKTRALLYNAAAAGTGWGLGLLDLFSRAITACGTDTSIGGALALGIGSCLVIAHVWDRRTRHWWIGLAWAARIPLATAITALALYTPGTQL
ncbi:hypothetical protein CU044_3748 [Streptomyces sp. L-9-10]|uniref:hypothetical protein n=1 Tax=Streptomyces sp. L-9-10 TaxID=1478131 RepID=UPI00101BD0F1|nr:hypothetical protein [Streptomyces sp. L-9-10]RYJ26455.1 hypothetical protein CU044_3748 [Streptomyces sp. L-9-10]